VDLPEQGLLRREAEAAIRQRGRELVETDLRFRIVPLNETSRHPDDASPALETMLAQHGELLARYPEERYPGLRERLTSTVQSIEQRQLSADEGAYFLAVVDSAALGLTMAGSVNMVLGSGGVRRYHGDGLFQVRPDLESERGRIVETFKLYTAPWARGAGVADAVNDARLDYARVVMGATVAIGQTARNQPESLAFHSERRGYELFEPYDRYPGSEAAGAVAFMKRIDPQGYGVI